MSSILQDDLIYEILSVVEEIPRGIQRLRARSQSLLAGIKCPACRPRT